MGDNDERTTTAAKLTHPTLDRLLPRPCLVDRIAQWQDRPVRWLGAPPGYGKTSLTAAYLAHVSPASDVWYQIDADDSDAATFFRQFYARLAIPAVVVFDNVHELSGDGLAALAVGLHEIPQGITVLALSREDPPAALARLEAKRWPWPTMIRAWPRGCVRYCPGCRAGLRGSR